MEHTTLSISEACLTEEALVQRCNYRLSKAIAKLRWTKTLRMTNPDMGSMFTWADVRSHKEIQMLALQVESNGNILASTAWYSCKNHHN